MHSTECLNHMRGPRSGMERGTTRLNHMRGPRSDVERGAAVDSRAWSDTLALAAPGRGASDTTSLSAFTLLASNFPSIKETISAGFSCIVYLCTRV